MTQFRDLKTRLLNQPIVRRSYDALDAPFALIEARALAGLSQIELAKRMKTTQSAIARLESGRAKPSTRTLQRFAGRRSIG